MVVTTAAEQTEAERYHVFLKIAQAVRAELEFKPRSFWITFTYYIIIISCVPLAKSLNPSEPCFPHVMSDEYSKDNYLTELSCRLIRKCPRKHLITYEALWEQELLWDINSINIGLESVSCWSNLDSVLSSLALAVTLRWLRVNGRRGHSA